MDIDWIREHCLALAHTTEKVQWEDDLVFKIGEKMYAVVALEPGDHWLSFKCTDEEFASLIERPGIIPAPYMARAHWVSLETHDALPRHEIKRLLSDAYALIFAKLPKKTQLTLNQPPTRKSSSRIVRTAGKRK
jgi:predicted DNA-binding protein (MmcQ/YjbR family)